jgi:hypothetical protein
MPEIDRAPTVGERLKELLIARFGWRGCRHDYRLVQQRRGTSIRCCLCGHETELFQIVSDRKP